MTSLELNTSANSWGLESPLTLQHCSSLALSARDVSHCALKLCAPRERTGARTRLQRFPQLEAHASPCNWRRGAQSATRAESAQLFLGCGRVPRGTACTERAAIMAPAGARARARSIQGPRAALRPHISCLAVGTHQLAADLARCLSCEPDHCSPVVARPCLERPARVGQAAAAFRRPPRPPPRGAASLLFAVCLRRRCHTSRRRTPRAAQSPHAFARRCSDCPGTTHAALVAHGRAPTASSPSSSSSLFPSCFQCAHRAPQAAPTPFTMGRPSLRATALAAAAAASALHGRARAAAELLMPGCDGTCAATWSPCFDGASFWACCEPGDECVYKSDSYAQCRPVAAGDPTASLPDWPGARVLENCELPGARRHCRCLCASCSCMRTLPRPSLPLRRRRARRVTRGARRGSRTVGRRDVHAGVGPVRRRALRGRGLLLRARQRLHGQERLVRSAIARSPAP